jgi:hypothetical protein
VIGSYAWQSLNLETTRAQNAQILSKNEAPYCVDLIHLAIEQYRGREQHQHSNHHEEEQQLTGLFLSNGDTVMEGECQQLVEVGE